MARKKVQTPTNEEKDWNYELKAVYVVSILNFIVFKKIEELETNTDWWLFLFKIENLSAGDYGGNIQIVFRRSKSRILNTRRNGNVCKKFKPKLRSEGYCELFKDGIVFRNG